MKNILVLCTGNSCRSQMAHGYLREFAADKAIVYSAGIETHGLNKDAVASMKADNIEISDHTSNHIDEYKSIVFDYVITVCDNARENCPYFPSKAVLFHQNFSDPSKMEGDGAQKEQNFARIRNEIKSYCRNFVDNNL